MQVNHAPYAEPRTSHSQTRGAAVAVSLMAHRHRNLSQCRHTLCRCTLALCTHSLGARGVWGSCPSCLQEQLFLSGAREGACTPSTTCDLPQAFGREIILQFGKPHQMHKRPVGATAKSRQSGSTSLPQPSGRAVCLTLKRKRTFAPSSGSEEASAGLKPIKASCEK